MFSGDTIKNYYQRVYALMRTDIIDFNLSDIDYMMPFEMVIYFGQLKESAEQIKQEQQKLKNKTKR